LNRGRKEAKAMQRQSVYPIAQRESIEICIDKFKVTQLHKSNQSPDHSDQGKKMILFINTEKK